MRMRFTVVVAALVTAVAAHAQTNPNQGPIGVTQQQLDTGEPFDAQSGIKFGYAARLWGNAAAVGAPGADGHGAVYVFVKSSTGAWRVRDKILPPEIGLGTFGAKIAFDGASLLIADPMRQKVYYFLSTSHGWQPAARLSGTAGFGTDLVMQGCTALITSDGATTDRGYVHVFDRCVAGANPWKWLRSLTPADTHTSDRFGAALALSGGGEHLLVGAPDADNNLGAVYYYLRDGATWTLKQRIVQGGVRTMPSFGLSVALDTWFALVGSRDNVDTNSGEPPSGFVYTFRRSGSKWTQLQQLQPTGTPEETYISGFGQHLLVQSNRVIISAPEAFSTFQRTPGTVFIYKRSGTNSTTLTLQERLVGNGGDFSRYGDAIDATRADLIVGEWNEGHTGCCQFQEDGATFIYRLPQ
jgi:hypothetical protein